MIHASCRTSDSLSWDSRRLIWAVAETLDQYAGDPMPNPLTISEWPAECPDIASSVEKFLPTSILLNDVQWTDHPTILIDRSLDEFPGFLTAIYMAESVENLEWGRLKVIAGRTFLQPPSVPDEDETRFEMMAALGKGVPMLDELGFRPGMLLRRLRGLDPVAVNDLSPGEQMALVTVAASRDGEAAFLSESGEWPNSTSVAVAAVNNRCTIHRFTLEGIPEESLDRIRNSRYMAPGHEE